MNLISNSKTQAITGLLAIGADTAIDAAHRVAALNSILFYSPRGIEGDDRFEITTAGETALREAEVLADGSTPPAAPPAEAPKQRKPRKPKEEPAPVQAPPAEQQAPIVEPEPVGRGITDTPEDRQEPEAAPAAEPEVDWDAPTPPPADSPAVTKTDLIALLNRYAAKHPKKAAGAKEVLATHAGTESLSAVDPSDYGAIATAMKLYLDAA